MPFSVWIFLIRIFKFEYEFFSRLESLELYARYLYCFRRKKESKGLKKRWREKWRDWMPSRAKLRQFRRNSTNWILSLQNVTSFTLRDVTVQAYVLDQGLYFLVLAQLETKRECSKGRVETLMEQVKNPFQGSDEDLDGELGDFDRRAKTVDADISKVKFLHCFAVRTYVFTFR